jgi:hypothetical protein
MDGEGTTQNMLTVPAEAHMQKLPRFGHLSYLRAAQNHLPKTASKL